MSGGKRDSRSKKPRGISRIAQDDLGCTQEEAERISRVIHKRRMERAAAAREANGGLS